jgi:hypothetical protein
MQGGLIDNFMPDQDVDGIKNVSIGKGLYVWGVVSYEDIFGDPHETEFCQNLLWLWDGKIFGIYTPGHNKAS